MMRWISAYLATALAFVAMDFVWLTQTNGLYQREIGPLLLAAPKLGPAVLFYLLYLLGLVIFVVGPALDQRRWSAATIKGALFGFIAYATYDLTNLATLKGFSARLTLIDLAWGLTISAVASTIGYFITRRLPV
jgi:uncharacterized membrane protein